MKFAVFFELPVPRPWTPGKEQAVIRNAIEQLGRYVIPECAR